jgi:VIT1/CCC1 family predicted Fe2+/Mn2+ transporter
VAALSFTCFAVGAFLPVVPWFVGSSPAATIASIVIGVIAAAVVGTVIGRMAERPAVLTAVRQVGILLVACGVTYLLGRLLGTAS